MGYAFSKAVIIAAFALGIGLSGALAGTGTGALPGVESGAPIVLAANGVTGAHAIRNKGEFKVAKRRVHKGYWQECDYSGYCRYVYNGSGGYLKAARRR